jgi:antitoxin VapB
MAYHIKDPETDRIIRELAKVKQQPIASVIKEACRKELEQEKPGSVNLRAASKSLQQWFDERKDKANPVSEPDKAFFDELWGE